MQTTQTNTATYYVYDMTAKNGQIERKLTIEQIKAKHNVEIKPSRNAGDFTVWYDGYVVGYLFEDYTQYKNYLASNGY